ncbi:hypothetical protein [Flavihumibacter petaseus]|uniref:Glycosyltransferase RgtA/B/C/D-like domain-containing protein n=1 Tax=Flavihumibacter petaseus NBRC 106054 TaxID=1220578 RepID=A0A0E9MUM9_9BACT|nr:hypothetical protein [Flavihumibacter petaseus]GAO41193.1 hypothetical protein FPE01S_01_02050 [Flavihumibacter petaseus NBRC 106054]
MLRTLFLVLVTLLLLSAGLCCFFQSPTMDDFVGTYLVKHYGYCNGVLTYLRHGNGRFSSIPLFVAISSTRFLVDHYWIVLISGLLALFLTLAQVLKSILENYTVLKLRGADIYMAGGLALLLLLSCVPEISSFLYWQATVATYQFGLILLLLLALLLFQLAPQHSISPTQFLLLVLLKAGAAGANEVTLLYGACFSLLVFCYRPAGSRWSSITLSCLAIDLMICVLVWFIPGNRERSDGFSMHHQITLSSASAVYRSMQLFAGILSSPVFWISLAALPFAAKYVRPEWKDKWLTQKLLLLPGGLMLVTMPVFFHFVIRQFGGEVVPPRAENIVVAVSVLGMLLLAFIACVQFPVTINLPPNIPHKFTAVIVLTAILCSSRFFRELPQNLFLLPLHHQIVQDRVTVIRQALQNGRQKVYIAPYKATFQQLLSARMPKVNFGNELSFPPSFSYFKDDPYNFNIDYGYAEYYGIDSLQTDRKLILRWELTKYYPLNVPLPNKN